MPHYLESVLGYTFCNATLLKQALHHKSAAPQEAFSPFERLEFLGDRVLGLVISQWLYRVHTQENEQFLALRLSHLTDRYALSKVASSISLASHITHAKDKNALHLGKDKMLSDTMEAILGALFLDAGLNIVRARIKRLWKPLFEKTAATLPQQDAKSMLQAWSQRHYGVLPHYQMVKKTGADHAPEITVALTIPSIDATKNGILVMQTTAASRKKAEQQVAKLFLEKYTQ